MNTMIKYGLQFKRNIADLDVDLASLRRKVKLQNALWKYEHEEGKANGDLEVNELGRWRACKQYRVEVFYRLGENNPWAGYYTKEGRRARRERTWGPIRIKREHAAYAAVYVMER